MAVTKVQYCSPMGNGLEGLGKFMYGLSLSHGKTEFGGCDTVTETSIRGITHLSDEERGKLSDYINSLFDKLATECKDAYCKSDAFTDFDDARIKFDELSEEFSRLEAEGVFDDALNELGLSTDRYDKVTAHNDSMDEVNHIFKDYEKDYLPKLLNRQCEHGVYNDTATQLLVDNAYAETVNKSATLVLNTYKDYEKITLEGAGLKIGLLRDFMNHAYRMTKLQLDQVELYFQHMIAFADLALKATQIAIESESKDDFEHNLKTCYGKKEQHSINVDEFLSDTLYITAGLTLLKLFLFGESQC